MSEQWKYLVIIELKLNDETDPSLWRWNDLLDLATDEEAVVKAYKQTSPEENENGKG